MTPLITASWNAETCAAVILALSRCIDVLSKYWYKRLFDGNRAWWWLVVPTVYSLWFGLFTKPLIFSGIFVAWFFNPHAGYVGDESWADVSNGLSH